MKFDFTFLGFLALKESKILYIGLSKASMELTCIMHSPALKIFEDSCEMKYYIRAQCVGVGGALRLCAY